MSDLVQGSEAWLNFRRDKIMASESSSIMGLNPWEDANELFRRKMGLLPPKQSTPEMEEGQRLEREAREFFIAVNGVKVHPMVMIHPEVSYMGASLDGVSEDGRILEIKCGEKQYEEISKGSIPRYIYCQIQHQIFVCEADMAFLLAYRGPQRNHLETVERDEVFISELLVACKDFYRRMREFDPPPSKHRKLETKEMEEAVSTYLLAKDMLARAEKQEQEARGRLLELSGGMCIEGFGLKVTHYSQKGSIDYGAIPALKGIDLERYRKPPSIRTRIS